MVRCVPVWLVLLTVTIAGCANPHNCHDGKIVAAYNPGASLAVQPVPYTATYVLHLPPADAADKSPLNAHWTVRELSEGESIGFSRNENGELVAVAGRETIPLVDGAYCWHVSPQTELRGGKLALHETGKTLATVGRVSCQAVVGVLLLPFVVLWQIPVSPFPW